MLAAMSRTDACEFAMTPKQLAEMPGVRRTFVTRVVKKLRDKGTIATRRGVFTMKDEHLLRRTACECTTAIENHFDTVLHGTYPSG
jgi:DNA-binding transcriptional regulator YhcF (GntR family)